MVKLKQERANIAIEALDKAYVLYLHFPVGVCFITESDKIYQGTNIENASSGSTNCAERTTFFKVVSERERSFTHLVVAEHTSDPISPCGACRQVMVEFCAPDMPATLVGDNGVTRATTVRELLPCVFTERDLQLTFIQSADY